MGTYEQAYVEWTVFGCFAELTHNCLQRYRVMMHNSNEWIVIKEGSNESEGVILCFTKNEMKVKTNYFTVTFIISMCADRNLASCELELLRAKIRKDYQFQLNFYISANTILSRSYCCEAYSFISFRKNETP